MKPGFEHRYPGWLATEDEIRDARGYCCLSLGVR